MFSFSQGSWNPPGADLSFPRTLLDSSKVEAIRQTLSNPEILSLYQSIWENANIAVNPDDSTDGGRINRAMITKEAAFVILMDRKYENGNIITLPTAERDFLALKSKSLLENLNTHVGFQSGWVFYQEWQHRSKELITYLIAYDLLRGAGMDTDSLLSARDTLIRFTANLYHRAMDIYTILIFQFRFFNFQFNNHSIMTASALGLAAIVLNDTEASDPDKQPQNWINAGLWNLDNTLWVENGTYPRVSEPDTLAGYAEGPAYFEYAFQNAFPFIRSLGNFLPDTGIQVTFNQMERIIQNPWYDPRYDRLYDWMNKIRMPMGGQPSIHDSPIGFGTRITALSGIPEFNWDNPYFSAHDPFIRTQYIATDVAHGAIDDSLFQALPEAGNLVFRSGWDSAAIYLHFIGQHGIALNGAKSHHQGDASSFSLFAFGQLLSVDPGYPGASESDAVNKASDHSLILVNGNGPNPPNGEIVNTKTNTCYIENYFDTPGLDYGEVRTNYYGANIVRKILFIRNRYFLLNDFISSEFLNFYTVQLHGHGLSDALPTDPEGKFRPDFKHYTGTYQRDSVKLTALIITRDGNGVYTYELDSLATENGNYRHYSKMLVSNPEPSTDVLFLTSLFPTISEIPLIRTVFGEDSLLGITVVNGNFKDFLFIRQTGKWSQVSPLSSGLPVEIGGNGLQNFFSTDSSGECNLVYLENGDSVNYGARTLLTSNHPMDICYEKISPTIFSGYCSDTGIISLFCEQSLKVLQGKLQSLGYDPNRKLNKFQVNEKGNFRLEIYDGLPELNSPDALAISVCPNPSPDGHFILSLNSLTSTTVKIRLTDTSGRTVFSMVRMLTPGESLIPLSLEHLPAGKYNLISETTSGIRINGIIIP